MLLQRYIFSRKQWSRAVVSSSSMYNSKRSYKYQFFISNRRSYTTKFRALSSVRKQSLSTSIAENNVQTNATNSNNDDNIVNKKTFDPDFEQFSSATSHPLFIRHVNKYWPLRASARRMIPYLSDKNLLGFMTTQDHTKQGTLLNFICEQKEKHLDKVLLIRVGEFYEAFGVDALLLVEHCGLNAMGMKARAGCPIRNIQQTLDGLTNVGLSIAVFEEVEPSTSSKDNNNNSSNIKSRFLAQVVNPGSSTYVYNASLKTDDIEYREGPSFIGIQISSGGATTASSVSDTKSGSNGDGSLHYTIYEVALDSRMVRISERLTEDAARCIVESNAQHYRNINRFVNNTDKNSTNTNEMEAGETGMKLYISRTGGGGIPRRARNIVLGTSHPNGLVRLKRAEKNPNSFLEELLSSIARDLELPDINNIDSYRVLGAGQSIPSVNRNNRVAASSNVVTETVTVHPRPLYAPTAQQLGILPSAQVPDLVANLLPANDSPPSSRDFLRRWVLRPPPNYIADEMQELVEELSNLEKGLPPLRTLLGIGKLVSLTRSRQANAAMFRDLAELLETSICILSDTDYNRTFVNSLVNITSHECGIGVNPDQLLKQSLNTLDRVNNSINRDYKYDVGNLLPPPQVVVDSGSKFSNTTPTIVENRNHGEEGDDLRKLYKELLDRNEYDFRSALLPTASPNVTKMYDCVNKKRMELINTINREFLLIENDASNSNNVDNIGSGRKKSTNDASRTTPNSIVKKYLKYDVLNNKIILQKSMKDIISAATINVEYIHPRDRHGRLMSNKFSTDNVESATSAYIGACEDARVAVRSELRDLCDNFTDEHHLLTSIANVQLLEILLAMSLHAREFVRRGWTLPLLEKVGTTNPKGGDNDEGRSLDPVRLSLPNLRPYWLDKRAAVTNNIDLNGQWLLSGANMSGKSTLLRSVTAAALLANCGLAAPIQYDSGADDNHNDDREYKIPIPRLDGYFLRTNGSDCPSEGLSAFALEADDMRILLRDLTSRSLAAIDELGRGTSPQEGAAIVGAMLEEFDKRKCPSIFATHLQMELQKFNLHLTRTKHKVLEITEGSDGNDKIKWTYKLKDGICDDAHSIATAREHKVPEYILKRAQQLRLGKNNRNVDESIENNLDDQRENENGLHNNCKKRNRKNEIESPQTLKEVINMLKMVPVTQHNNRNHKNCGDVIDTEIDLNNTVLLNPGWEPPPRIADGVACVYILSIGDGSSFYVGETEGISTRIAQHRRRFGSDIKVGIIPIENNGGRSVAQYYESYFIDQLHLHGITLLNIRD
jgi:hypothetical protein